MNTSIDSSRRERGLVTLVLAMCGVVGVLVIAMFAVLLLSVINLRANASRSRSTLNLPALSFNTERSTVDLETGLRGYLLTGQTNFLAPYTQARSVLPGQLAELQRLAASPAEKQDARAITTAIKSYIATYAQPLVAGDGKLTRAQNIATTVHGKRLFDALRTRFATFDATVQQMLARRRQRTANSSTRTLVLAAIGLVGSILLLGGLVAYILRNVLQPVRVVARAAARLTGGELDVRVPTRGRGEVALLGRSFNSMAASLQQRESELSEANGQLGEAVLAAREASRLKSSFLANMSHEIRTPLHGVIGMMSLLEETPLEPEQRQYVSTGLASGENLMNVINDVLDFSKIEAGRLELEQNDFDLHETIETTCEILAPTVHAKGLELQVFIEKDVPRGVRGDRARVSQVLTNLLSNAAKFTPDGEIVVEARLAVGTETSEFLVRLEVRDTGIGIDPRQLDGLFNPFVQADSSTTRHFGGTGLGLAISSELMGLMGGTLDVHSEPGKGSTFICTIPFKLTRGTITAPTPRTELQGLKVLIVDDSATNRKILEAYTTSWGMRPTSVPDAEGAIARLQQAVNIGESFEVALLDYLMPSEDGLQLTRRIRASPTLRGTRLIMLSSSGEHSEPILAAGVEVVLAKPVRQSRLLEAINDVMNGRPHHLAVDHAPSTKNTDRSQPNEAVKRVLVAEDQAVNRLFIADALARHGYTVDAAVDGREVLEMLQADDGYDLILMDCQMPEVDGYDATREIRRREHYTGDRHIPIVAMTAHAMQGDREKCLGAGMDDYMAKPLRLAQVDEMLARWLSPINEGLPK
jgi:two-component system, sensor histidine kinase and response regulator